MGQSKITHFENIIVGGGIVGSGIFRDLALQKRKVLLLEKGDFNSQTSQASSKMLHGGIRYLENFDFFLVNEALREKNHWLKVAPHLCYEDKFVLPIYKESKYPLWMLRIGLFLYDALSFFRNSPHIVLNAKQTKAAIQGISTEGLSGAGMYADGIVNDHLLGLECIYDGLIEKGTSALNYHEVIALTKNDNIYELTVLDTINKSQKQFSCEQLFIALGPFTDEFFKQINYPWQPVMLLSKGSHVWLKRESLNIHHPMVLQTKDGRIIFVIPERQAILIGTTEVELEKDESIFNIMASEVEIEYLLQNVNHYFPTANLTKKDILGSFAGVRPLVSNHKKISRGKTSRNHRIFEPSPGMYVIAGGKYTTFRVMAADIIKLSFKRLGLRYNKKKSLLPLRQKSLWKKNQPISEEQCVQIISQEMAKTYNDLYSRRLSLINDQQLNEEELKILKEIKQKYFN